MHQSTSISFGGRSSGDGDLIIEQKKPGYSDGYLSRGGMYNILWHLLEGEDMEAPDCVPEVGGELYVYRYDISMPYSFHLSYGNLGERFVESDLTFTQKMKFSMEDSQSFNYPNFGVVNYGWLGNKVWDEDGNETTPPGFTPTIREITLTKKVYGTFAVTYRIHRDKYTFSTPRREDTEENKYSSVAYALHVGGPTWKVLDVPPGAEEHDMSCFGGGGLIIEPDDDPDKEPPYAPNRDAQTNVDYCTQEITSESP